MTDPERLRDTVLVVDDSDDALRFLTHALSEAGNAVLVAKSGEAALDILDHFTPDLILMDAVMPGIDGFETTRRVKAQPAKSHVPILFMTGLTESEHVVRAFEVGGVDFVRKPVYVDELLARVRVHMAQGRAAQASAAGLDATGRMLMAVALDGRFLWCTPLAEQAIARNASEWTRESQSLPPDLRPSVARLIAMRDNPGATVKVDRDSHALELVLLSAYRDHELLVRLNEVSPEADVEELRQRLPVTQREAEVLLWVSYGKPNRVISDILMISPRTVNKHLERIFEKLGVETRSAAAAIAIRAIGS